MLDHGVLAPVAQCDAEKLPFPDDYFDCVSVAFGLRNMTHKESALAEMRRVLRPGGRLLVLEFSKVWQPLQAAYDVYSTLITALKQTSLLATAWGNQGVSLRQWVKDPDGKVLIIGGFLLAAAVAQPIPTKPLAVSKLNTALQIALVAVVLAQLGLGLADFGAALVLGYAVALTTVLSGGGYLVRWMRGSAGEGA